MSIYQKIGLRRVVNACGRVTILGVSTLSDDVAQAAIEGGQSYVVIEELINRAGEIISTYTGAEDSCVTSCASAGICLTVAGLVSQGRKSIMDRLPDSTGLSNEIILQKGHAIEFGAPINTMIRLGGGVPVEVGTVNEICPEDIEEAITEKTVALLYVKSHHCVQKGMVSIEAMRDIAHRHNLPLMVDAAAEEDFRKYIALGADLVVYSGAKALEATTSGFVTGKKKYITNIKKQYHGIGRPMKVGKEGIAGLLKALEQYENKDMEKSFSENKEKVHYLCEEINKIHGLRAEQIQDEAGRAICRARISLDPAVNNKKTIADIKHSLEAGDPCVYARAEFLNLGKIDLDPRPLIEGDKELIVNKLKEIMED